MRKIPTQQGFSLIEIIVSIGMIALLSGGIIAFERNLLTNTKVLQSQLIAQQQARRTLAGFVADVRSSTVSAAGAYPIDTAATNTLIFYANIDNDNAIERVRYFRATTTLKRGIIKPVGTVYNPSSESVSTVAIDVANGTSSPIFLYYDSNYDGFTSSSTDPLPIPINIPAIRLIKISLTLNPNGVRAPVMQTYVTQVSIRNLKDNL